MIIRGVVFNERKPYFDGLGTKMTGKVDYETALRLGGLNYTVEKVPSYIRTGDGNFVPVPNQFHTVRTDTNQVLDTGTVGKDYKVIQNREAFKFVEDLLADGIGVEAAGHYDRNGNHSFIIAQGESLNVLGDEVANHLFISNSFDGKSSVMIMFTPMRIVCSNGMIVADTKLARGKFTVGHFSNAEERLKFANQLMMNNLQYMHMVKRYSEWLAGIYMTEDEFSDLCAKLFPAPEGDEEPMRAKRSREEQIERLKRAYEADDIANFSKTAYKAIMAVSDVESHGEPLRKRADTAKEFQLRAILGGMKLMNEALNRVKDLYGYRAKTSL